MKTHKHLITMMYMQHRLNTVIDMEWFKKNQDFPLAIMVETGEFADHLGWKWWSKQESNVEQAIMELVDIWHFGLAMIARACIRDLPELEFATEAEWQQHLMVVGMARKAIDELPEDGEGCSYHGELEEADVNVKALACVKGVAVFALEDESFAMGYALEALRLLGVSREELFRRFVGKNVLNLFRQSNGYKTGSYKKVWFGEEDNVVLERMMAEWTMEAGVVVLQEKLAEKYREVCATIQ